MVKHLVQSSVQDGGLELRWRGRTEQASKRPGFLSMALIGEHQWSISSSRIRLRWSIIQNSDPVVPSPSIVADVSAYEADQQEDLE